MAIFIIIMFIYIFIELFKLHVCNNNRNNVCHFLKIYLTFCPCRIMYCFEFFTNVIKPLRFLQHNIRITMIQRATEFRLCLLNPPECSLGHCKARSFDGHSWHAENEGKHNSVSSHEITNSYYRLIISSSLAVHLFSETYLWSKCTLKRYLALAVSKFK